MTRRVYRDPDLAKPGRYIYLLAKLIGARRILEIGTTGGYSTIWLAGPCQRWPPRLESEKKHADVARRNIAHAKLDDKVEVRVGAALKTLTEFQGRPSSTWCLLTPTRTTTRLPRLGPQTDRARRADPY